MRKIDIKDRPSQRALKHGPHYLKSHGQSTMRLKSSIYSKLSENTKSYKSQVKQNISEFPSSDALSRDLNVEHPPWWSNVNLGKLEVTVSEFKKQIDFSENHVAPSRPSKRRYDSPLVRLPAHGLVYTPLDYEKRDPVSSFLISNSNEPYENGHSRELEKAKIQECIRRIIINKKKRI